MKPATDSNWNELWHQIQMLEEQVAVVKDTLETCMASLDADQSNLKPSSLLGGPHERPEHEQNTAANRGRN